MELFLNLCWLSLLLPAWVLWRQRTASNGQGKSTAAHPLVFLCVLGCALVLLFPVISASDDLHAMRPEMEESERAFRHASHCTSAAHVLPHSSQPVLPSSASLTPEFAPMGAVIPFRSRTLATLSAPAPAGRAPPSDRPTEL